MRVLGISLDPSILDKESAVAKRVVSFGRSLDKYYLLVPSRVNKTVQLADNIWVESLAGTKVIILWKIYKRIKELLKVEKLDLLTTQDVYFIAPILIHLAKKFGAKFEAQIHGFEKLRGIRKVLAKYALAKAQIVRTVSVRMKKYLVESFGIAENIIYIAPVFVNKEKILKNLGRVNLRKKYQGSFVFLTIGRLVPVKNIALQIKALSKLNQKVKLVIVGDGPEEDQLRKLAKDLKVEDSIELVGKQVADLPDYYKTADCLLLTSNIEGYGMVVAEAVLADLPVIMTDVGCAGELVENNVNGLVIAIDDFEALVDSMNKVMEDRNLLLKFKEKNPIFKSKILSNEDLSKIILDSWQSKL